MLPNAPTGDDADLAEPGLSLGEAPITAMYLAIIAQYCCQYLGDGLLGAKEAKALATGAEAFEVRLAACRGMSDLALGPIVVATRSLPGARYD